LPDGVLADPLGSQIVHLNHLAGTSFLAFIAGTDLRRQWRAAIAPLRQDVATWLIRLPGRELGRVGILG
jgi:hypothetical protein